jgi:predicted DNA-binding transcriptional regulator AlpA
MADQLTLEAAKMQASADGAGSEPSVISSRFAILGDDLLLTVEQVAGLVGVSKRQIYHMIHRGTFPPPRKLHALSRWPLRIIKDWLRNGPRVS